MKLSKFFASIVLLAYFVGCSTTPEVAKRETKNYNVVKKYVNDVKLEVGKNVSWVNLMPGTQHKFHISGKVTLIDDLDYDFTETNLKFVKIYQGTKEFYYIAPKVIDKLLDGKKEITYSTIKGLNVNPELDVNKPVRFELIFVQGKKELKYYIRGLKVEEVY